ncbi:hypothetical protein PENSPDRAFT_758596 [Peniophora sp. CONT]|nr:hypothetical protein PENSPDRAFT_758596 [Peniophora sp. CONT]
MFGITHRTARAIWLGFIMLSSVTCFTFALAVHRFFGRPSDVCTLTIVPAVCFISCSVALSANYLFKGNAVKCVAMELLWAGSSSPLALIMGLYTYAVVPSAEHPDVLWPIYVARILAWELAVAVTLYLIGILTLAVLTSQLIDRDVWLRPIAGSPSPFPLALMWHLLRHQEPTGGNEKEAQMCPPGCACARKLEHPDSDSDFVHIQSGEVNEQITTSREAERVPGIRVPNVVERNSFIAVGLRGYEGEMYTDV